MRMREPWLRCIGTSAPLRIGDSRKKHRSIEAALNKVITQDTWHQKRQSGALCSNDAKSCYDRVARSFAVLCLFRLGCPLGPVLSMFTALQQMQHFIGTAFGVSSTSCISNEFPFQGLGQGSGAGPTGWAVVRALPLSTWFELPAMEQPLSLLFPVPSSPLSVTPSSMTQTQCAPSPVRITQARI